MTRYCEHHGQLAGSCTECDKERRIEVLEICRDVFVAERDTARRWSRRWKEAASRAYNIIGHHADVTRELEAARRWSRRWKSRFREQRADFAQLLAAFALFKTGQESELEAARARLSELEGERNE